MVIVPGSRRQSIGLSGIFSHQVVFGAQYRVTTRGVEVDLKICLDSHAVGIKTDGVMVSCKVALGSGGLFGRMHRLQSLQTDPTTSSRFLGPPLPLAPVCF